MDRTDLHGLVVPEHGVGADAALPVVDDRALVVGAQEHESAVKLEQILLAEPFHLAVGNCLAVADHPAQTALGRKHLGHRWRLYRSARDLPVPRPATSNEYGHGVTLGLEHCFGDVAQVFPVCLERQR